MTAAELIEAIETRSAVLYGAGYVAEMFHRILEEHGIAGHIEAVIVSDTTEAPETFHGIPVESAAIWAEHTRSSDIQQPFICVATHEAVAGSILGHIEKLGIGEGIWVYPFLHELAFGKPFRTNVQVPTGQLLAAQPAGWHWIAARAAALSELDGKTDCGKNAYIKCMSLHCSKTTAEKRLEQFEDIVLEQRTANAACEPSAPPILVDEDLRVIDGLHRLAYAAYRGAESMTCDIVATSPLYGVFFTSDNTLDDAALDRAGLTDDEHGLIVRLQAELVGHAKEQVLRSCPAISVIVPIYNVEDYLDVCMESLVAQTFEDFEVLLINDGSTDGSGARCAVWAARDGRVRFIDQPNGGVSSARNRGIEEARGTYLAFVDPDDWLDERYLEKLHARAIESGADFVECDIWRYSNRSGSKIHRFCGQRMGVPYTLAEHMKYGPTASYKSLSTRTLWIDNDVRFPSCAFESPAIYALVLALAEHVEYIPEPLYYYRRFRENSLIETAYAHKDGTVNNTLGVEAMEYLVEQFRAHGLSEKYAKDLPGIVLYRLNDILAMQYHRKTPADFAELVANYRTFVARELPQVLDLPYLTWGGYNLSKICQHMPLLHDPSRRFGFSSLISLLGDEEPRCELSHRNPYRQMMLAKEMDRVFEQTLEREQTACIICDLIEERFDVAEWHGRYLTLSDAFEGAGGIGKDELRIIKRDDTECAALFERAVDRLCCLLEQHAPRARVIVVENYLSETVGDLEEQREYADVVHIRKLNELLQGYYELVCDRLPSVVRIPAFKAEHYFTDKDYEYGALPSHLNALVNQEIAQMIEEVLT